MKKLLILLLILPFSIHAQEIPSPNKHIQMKTICVKGYLFIFAYAYASSKTMSVTQIFERVEGKVPQPMKCDD